MLLWLLLLGILTYFIVRRSVVHITRTPVWVLWLVMMLPALVCTAWVAANGDSTESIQQMLLLGAIAFVVSSILYWVLVQWGRTVKPELAATVTAPVEPPAPVRSIDKDEEAHLHNCFPWSVYYLQNIEHRPQALICRGQLRTSPDVAYKTIRENVEAQFSDRFLVVFQEGFNGKPFFVLVPNAQSKTAASPPEETYFRPGLALGLLLTTCLTTTLAGVGIAQKTPILITQWSQLWVGLPYAMTLMLILSVHELGHYFMARRYRIRTTLPYFIPVPPSLIPFGTFGAFIQRRSPTPHRKALFDIGIAGPLAGFLIAVPLVLWGLAHSTPVPIVTPTDPSQVAHNYRLFNFSAFQPGASLLMTLFSKLALGNRLTANSAIQLHPVAIAGWLGILITALNLMPIGQLDGGHIVHAMFGQRVASAIGQLTRFLVLAISFVQRELFLWAILLFFMPTADEPALNDVSDLDDRRDFLGVLSLCLLVLIILPAPQALIQILFK